MINEEETYDSPEYNAIISLPLAIIPKHELLQLMSSRDDSIFFIKSNRDGFETIGIDAFDDQGMVKQHTTSFLKCTVCNEVVSAGQGVSIAGGHINRHLKSKNHMIALRKRVQDSNLCTDEVATKKSKSDKDNSSMLGFVIPKLTSNESTEISEAIARLCLRSGKSFHFLESDGFRGFIRDLLCIKDKRFNSNEIEKQFPSRETIARHARKLFEEVVKKVYAKISPHISDGICLAIDYGLVRESHLAIHITFIEEIKGVWCLVVLPLGFKGTTEPKTKDEVFKQVIEVTKQYGITTDDFKSSYLVADGGSNMAFLGKDKGKFKDYIRCFNHSLNLLFERSVRPYEDCVLSTEDRQSIRSAKELIDSIRTISNTLKTCRQLTSRFAIPNPGSAVRWLSFYQCVCQMRVFLKLIDDDVLTVLPPLITFQIESMKKDMPRINTIEYVYRLLPERMKVFQSNDVTIHHCLPTIRKLRDDFHNTATENHDLDLTDYDDVLLRALATAAHHAAVRHQKQLAPVHYGAVMLNPRSRKMSAFTEGERIMARNFIQENMKDSVHVSSDASISNKKATVYDDFDDSCDLNLQGSELERYINEPSTPDIEIHTYWPSKKTVYPGLYRLARLVFSVLPSEAVCERAFSKSGHLIDKRRSSLSMDSVDWIITAAQLLEVQPNLLV